VVARAPAASVGRKRRRRGQAAVDTSEVDVPNFDGVTIGSELIDDTLRDT
jgi:hypothetical protein